MRLSLRSQFQPDVRLLAHRPRGSEANSKGQQLWPSPDVLVSMSMPSLCRQVPPGVRATPGLVSRIQRVYSLEPAPIAHLTTHIGTGDTIHVVASVVYRPSSSGTRRLVAPLNDLQLHWKRLAYWTTPLLKRVWRVYCALVWVVLHDLKVFAWWGRGPRSNTMHDPHGISPSACDEIAYRAIVLLSRMSESCVHA